ncbi:MAG: hypothetical protein ACI4R8_03735 [Candidatus Caccovivens sp.]
MKKETSVGFDFSKMKDKELELLAELFVDLINSDKELQKASKNIPP